MTRRDRTDGEWRRGVLGVLLLAALPLLMAGPAAAQGLAWPPGKTSAVCLTHDDGLRSHLTHAMPQLEKRGFRGTFFLTREIPEADRPLWKAAADRGHELGNHSFTHPCYSSYAFVQATGFAVDRYSPEQMRDDIARMGAQLFEIDGQAGPRTYAYPCYNKALIDGNFGMTPLGDGSSTIELARRSGLITYARGGDTRPVVTDFKNLDLMYVPSMMYPGGPIDDMLAHVDAAAASGGLLVISLHDIDGPALPISLADYERLLDILAAREEIWVAPFDEVMRYIENTRGAPQ